MLKINWISGPLVLLLLATLAVGQPASPRFEVASVKPAPELTWLPGNLAAELQNGYDIRPTDIRMPDPGRVEIRSSSLLTLISMAYGVPKATIRAPNWARETLFNVDARPPAGTPKEQVREMLRSLLEERFDLAAHNESEEKSGYALLVTKGGPRLAPAANPSPTARTYPDGAHNEELASALMKTAKKVQSEASKLPPGVSHYGFANVNTQQLAAIISRFVGAPVIDTTGLKGAYDVTLDVGKPEQPDYSILAAVEKLGLKLNRRRVRTDTLVVDRLEKAPAPN